MLKVLDGRLAWRLPPQSTFPDLVGVVCMYMLGGGGGGGGPTHEHVHVIRKS